MNNQKTAIITGATSGIGEATARLLAERGYKLILVGRREARLNTLQSELKTEVITLPLDIQDKQAVAGTLNSLLSKEHIDVLVNNAGVEIGLDKFTDKSEQDIQAMIDTNINGLIHMTYPVVKHMRKRDVGYIINIGSCAAYTPYNGGSVYGATKAFARQFCRSLRMDLLGTSIRLTNIEPGSVKTELAIGVNNFNKEKAKTHYDGFTPLESEDIANTILWLLNQPSHVNVDNIEIMPISQAPGGLDTYKL